MTKIIEKIESSINTINITNYKDVVNEIKEMNKSNRILFRKVQSPNTSNIKLLEKYYKHTYEQKL